MNDLVEVHSDELRVKTCDLWKALGYNEHRKMKEVINNNRDSFIELGLLPIQREKPPKGSKGGRPDESYLLNFEQILLLIALSKNSKGTSVKADAMVQMVKLITVASGLNILDLLKNLDIETADVDDRYVYVAKEAVSGRYKIGISRDPEARIKQLNTGNPEQLILVHAYLAIEHRHVSETLAHSLFNEHRLKGEWFNKNINLNLLPSYNGES